MRAEFMAQILVTIVTTFFVIILSIALWSYSLAFKLLVTGRMSDLDFVLGALTVFTGVLVVFMWVWSVFPAWKDLVATWREEKERREKTRTIQKED